MKKGIVLGIVLVLLALPYFVLGLEGENSKNAVKVTQVEHIISPTTEGVKHNYQDLSNMPYVSQETLYRIGSNCDKASDCGEPQRMGEPFCVGNNIYQGVSQPRCMIRQNASTPPICLYGIREVVIDGC